MSSLAAQYHDATKYAPETIGNHPGIDWAAQPEPFKTYDTATPVELAPLLPFDPNPFTGAPCRDETLANSLDLRGLSHWLFATYGITGVIPQQPRPTYLRASPSAGGLYPAEIYVVVRDLDGCEPGLYGYDPRAHRLAPLWSDVGAATQLAAAAYGNAAVAAAPVAVIVTGVFERSRWRYGERAYRRILLDSGHLLGNAGLVAPAFNLRVHITAAFCDAQVNTLLRVDDQQEGALAIIALNRPGVAERPAWTALPSATTVGGGSSGGSANTDDSLSFFQALHHGSMLPPTRPRLIARGESQAETLETRYGWSGGLDLALANDTRVALATRQFHTAVHRRSTRRFLRRPLSREQLARILAAAYMPASVGLGEQPALDRSQLMTFVAVLDVTGIPAGVYYLAPHALALRLVKAGVTRTEVQTLCLGQELGGDAAAVIFHTADLTNAVQAQGERAYRYLHLDAGIIGQALALAAISEGAGTSGIGGFFDDQAADLLGIPREQAVVYISCIGVPSA